MPANSFDYYTKRTTGDSSNLSDRLGAIEQKLGVAPTSALGSFFGGGEAKQAKKKGGGGLPKKLRKIGDIPIKNIRETERVTEESAQDYADFLAGQVSRGERSPIEASDMYADFGLAYNIPDAFKTATQLGSQAAGLAPEGTVEKYRPFQEFAARSLGIGLSAEDIKSTEEAARALGKTSPEAFTQFLGQKMLSSPEYVRKTPLAFAANLPYGGKYGVGYQTPDGTFTGTYRFKPPSTINYS
ncbi:MAG: hypothetical protein EHM17_14440 [Verrucomicrobiaceae bacterium]|jgi:hypothetical protein|nr:MAG: hypothetical protein EHM17_16455 [Verrucomicrobiaceae bacterium]RPJ31989.1 MAG: hypothetical protein EHM17_14440 [Verrucomicrobiaceae bacterium]